MVNCNSVDPLLVESVDINLHSVDKRKHKASKILANERILVDGNSEFKVNGCRLLSS